LPSAVISDSQRLIYRHCSASQREPFFGSLALKLLNDRRAKCLKKVHALNLLVVEFASPHWIVGAD
jgi:hypothetical protein